MNADRWAEVERICQEALGLMGAARQAFLDRACAADPDLRREVASLLAGEREAEGLLDVPAVEAAALVIGVGEYEQWASTLPGGRDLHASESLARGTRLGPYEIDVRLATGGMGEIYRAVDTRLRRRVAVKVLPPWFASDPQRLKRFQREAEAVAALDHPNILAIYDVGMGLATRGGPEGADQAAGGSPVPYLVTELLEGETLRERIARGPIPAEAVLDIALPMASALAAAHGKRIIHRDLKPSNVFLTSSGHVKLLDFGIAKILAAEGTGDQGPGGAGELRTDINVRLGSVGYMSPEQARGLAIDERADIFSFGAVLFEMLAGRRAFGGDSAAAVLLAILSKEAPPLSRTCPNVPAALDSLVSRCLAKQPGDRFQSAHDLERALAAVIPGGRRKRRVWPRRVLLTAVAALTLAVVGSALYQHLSQAPPAAQPPGAPAAAHPQNTIAVLPFRNLSADPADAYVAGGLHDELISQLSLVAALKVIGRTSVMGYRDRTGPLTRLADELGAGSVVEGSVQVDNRRLHVSVNLVDTATDQVLWTRHYDRPMDDTFAVQTEVARSIVAGLGEALSSTGEAIVPTSPTANAEAYRLYLQGRDYQHRPGSLRTDLTIAAQLFERAVRLDPGFALAHAGLSRVYGSVYACRFDPSPALAARAREEADTALRLAPDLAQARAAVGFVRLSVNRDFQGALTDYEAARRVMPNDAELWADIGYADRRLGNWKAVEEAYGRATELDPRSADVLYDLGGESFTLLHRYGEAVGAYDRALTLAPDLYQAAFRRAQAFILWRGQLDPMREMLAGLPEGAALGPHGSVAAQRAALLFLERDAAALLQRLEVLRAADFEGQHCFVPSALYRAWAHRLRGDRVAARAAFDSAAARLDAALRDLPDDWRLHVARGLAQAGLGRYGEARAEARWLRQSDVYRSDAYAGPMAAEGRAQILAECGDAAAALEELERLLQGPSWLSAHTLRLDPRWDPIRSNPRFQALLKTGGS